MASEDPAKIGVHFDNVCKSNQWLGIQNEYQTIHFLMSAHITEVHPHKACRNAVTAGTKRLPEA